ncbi:protein kinase [Kitasatospora sp. NPDC057936]|uniref:protein kinase domain-containing protein n=1 Tax=Kitasatospora sp. NPDC057936 TaxID=3346283 RepID=UPI0036D7DED4
MRRIPSRRGACEPNRAPWCEEAGSADRPSTAARRKAKAACALGCSRYPRYTPIHWVTPCQLSTGGTALNSGAAPKRLIGSRYQLLSPLGAGGMGRVWKAHDQQLDVDVAVKEIFRPPGIPDDYWQELLLRAERESRHGARLRNHPNIVAVYDVVVENGVPWTVMRLVNGTTLEERLTRGRLPVGEAAEVARAVLAALGAAHDAGIIHRDVKPANIMLAADGGILLTDFGIAINNADTKLTQDGSIIGSMAYIAPERADGQQGNEASDLFSLGVTLYQATQGGGSPFQRETLTSTLRAVAAFEPPPPTHAGYLTPLITALLHKEANARPTVAQALAMTTPAAQPAPPNPPATPPTPKTPSRPAPQPEHTNHYVVLTQIGDNRSAVATAISELSGLPSKEAGKIAGYDDTKARKRIVLRNVDKDTAVAAQRALAHTGATAVVTSRKPGFWFPYSGLVAGGVVFLLLGVTMTAISALVTPGQGDSSTNGLAVVVFTAMVGVSGALGLVLLSNALTTHATKETHDGHLRPGSTSAVVGLGIAWTIVLVNLIARHYTLT